MLISHPMSLLFRSSFLFSLCLLTAVERLTAVELWVSPNGAEKAAGSADAPLTLVAAQRRARELRRLSPAPLEEPVRMILRGGTYIVDAAWTIRPEDSGTAASPTIIEAAPGETPLLTGGVSLTGWEKPAAPVPGLPAAAVGHVWVAKAPLTGGRLREFRQLWVDDHKAVRARTPNDGRMGRLLAWDPANREVSIPTLPELNGDLTALEMVIYQQWEIAQLRVKSMDRDGERSRVRFHDPESRIQFEHPWPGPIMTATYRAPFFVVNALCLLDQPGEWFHDVGQRVIYYWPRPGEDLTRAHVIVPVQETLLRIAGTLDRPVMHVQVKGLHFAHTAWMRPSEFGHVPHQDGMFMTEAYKMLPPGTPDKKSLENQAWIGRPPGSVEVFAAQHVRFERCQFEHLASAGLDAQHGLRHVTIEGCVFRDIGGNGVQIGKFQDGGIETHVPYNPSDDREVCAEIRIANNLVSDCANEDWGCVGITAGYVRDTTIEHNDVSDLPYTGISIGWGWTRQSTVLRDNRVHANRIHAIARQLYDTAGIYLLSAQPGTVVSENSIDAIEMSAYTEKPHWGYIYLDEGSSHTIVRDNWCPTETFIKNANGPGNLWERNGPTVPDTVRRAAGLQPDYLELLSPPKPSRPS